MISFKPLRIEDKHTVDKYVRLEASQSADFNFGNMFMWDGRYNQQFAEVSGRLVVLTCTGGVPFFVYPIGSGPLAPVICEMREYAKENGFDLVLRGVERRHIAPLEEAFPLCFSFETNRAYFDYIYNAETLRNFSGKKLHSKRNFINRFVTQYNWHFEELSPKHFDACRELLKLWERSVEHDGEFLQDEHAAISRAFVHYETLGLFGGALFAEGQLAAFSIGEPLREDTFNVHFEKARRDIAGAYPMINRELVRLVLCRFPGVTHINREDDMGMENLRSTKLSFYPEFLLEKHTARWVACV